MESTSTSPFDYNIFEALPPRVDFGNIRFKVYSKSDSGDFKIEEKVSINEDVIGEVGRVFIATYYQKSEKKKGVEVACKLMYSYKGFVEMNKHLGSEHLKKVKKECIMSLTEIVRSQFCSMDWKNTRKHLNVVDYYGYSIDELNCELYIVSKLENQSLTEYLRESRGKMIPFQKLNIALDVIKGLSFLHKLHIFHGNLKGSNVLLSYEQAEGRFVAKLADFGISESLKESTSFGTPISAKSPYSTRKNEFEKERIGDCENCGALIFSLLIGREPSFNVLRKPFHGENKIDIKLEKVVKNMTDDNIRKRKSLGEIQSFLEFGNKEIIFSDNVIPSRFKTSKMNENVEFFPFVGDRISKKGLKKEEEDIIKTRNSFQRKIFNKDFNIYRRIGAGVHGRAFLATVDGIPNRLFAVKIMKKIMGGIQRRNDIFKGERLLMEIPYHRNVAMGMSCGKDETIDISKIPEYWKYPEWKKLGKEKVKKFKATLLVMECLRNSLHDSIRKREKAKIPFKCQEICSVLHGMLHGVSHLHNNCIVHRDLHPGNIFVDERSGRICIGDFGLAVKFGITEDFKISKTDKRVDNRGFYNTYFGGAADYLSPEIRKFDALKDEILDYEKNDLYAIGVIGKSMMNFQLLPQTMGNSRKKEVWEDLSKLVMRLLDESPKSRIGYGQACSEISKLYELVQKEEEEEETEGEKNKSFNIPNSLLNQQSSSPLSFDKIGAGMQMIVGISKSGRVFGSAIERERPVNFSLLTEIEHPDELDDSQGRFKDISVGSQHILLLDKSGQLYVLGMGMKQYELGLLHEGVENSFINTVKSPTKLEFFGGKKIKGIFCHQNNLVLTEEEDSVRAYVWGKNGYGMLGTNHKKHVKKPEFLEFSKDHVIEYASLCYQHSLVLVRTPQGYDVYSCGTNSHGQLGLCDTKDRIVFEKIDYFGKNNINIVQIQGGSQHSVFRSDEGKVYVCGSNHRGQLGLGDDIKTQIEPRLVECFVENGKTRKNEDVLITKIDVGWWGNVFYSSENKIYYCGNNLFGQSGINYESKVVIWKPQLVKFKKTAMKEKIVKSTAIGAGTISFMFSDGSLCCGGKNDAGQLGLGNTNDLLNGDFEFVQEVVTKYTEKRKIII